MGVETREYLSWWDKYLTPDSKKQRKHRCLWRGVIIFKKSILHYINAYIKSVKKFQEPSCTLLAFPKIPLANSHSKKIQHNSIWIFKKKTLTKTPTYQIQ